MELVDLDDDQEFRERFSSDDGENSDKKDPDLFMDDTICQALKVIEHKVEVLDRTLADLQRQRRTLCQERKVLLRKAQERNQRKTAVQDCDWENAQFPWSEESQRLALDVFGVQSFRPNQRSAINAVLSGRDTLLVMPTGGGKSLCYQLPSVMTKFDKKLTLVISPLLSLMNDQVSSLKGRGILSVALSGETSRNDFTAIRHAMKAFQEPLPQQIEATPKPPSSDQSESRKNTSEEGLYHLIYVTPERIAKSKLFMAQLERIYAADRLALFVIDEVHCVSRWGRSFRQDYQHLSVLKLHFPNVPFLCVTATATPKVIADVKSILKLSPSVVELKSPITRTNIYYGTLWKPKKHDDVMQLLIGIIRLFPDTASGLVYCLTRKEAEVISGDLNRLGKVRSSFYHADMTQHERAAVYDAWMTKEIQVVVATVAFGMGINKEDVRFVIHHSLPRSVDAFYQESGRSGRDGAPALSVILYRPTDIARQSVMVYWEPLGLQLLYAVVQYVTLSTEEDSSAGCRHKSLALHFGEHTQSLGNSCAKMCDFCFNPLLVSDWASGPHKRLKTESIAETRSLAGDTHLAIKEGLQLLRDIQDDPQTRYTLTQFAQQWRKRLKPDSPFFQGLPRGTGDDLERLLDLGGQLLAHGWIQEDFAFTPYATNSYCSLAPAGLNHLLDTPSSAARALPKISLLATSLEASLQRAKAVYDHLFPAVSVVKPSITAKEPRDVIRVAEWMRLFREAREKAAEARYILGHFILPDVDLQRIESFAVHHCTFHEVDNAWSLLRTALEHRLVCQRTVSILEPHLRPAP